MNDDDNLIQNLQKRVKESQTDLDAGTLGQLRAARLTAIESLSNKPHIWWQLPVTRYVVSSSIAIALTISFIYPTFNTPNEEYDMDIVAISEDIELLENLDFYIWIIDTVENES
jgi:hypothetical protein